ncbi:MAG: autotransporter outer membrane beta-barrel domain-containing protein [Akkermansia sp.]|nr:autotransporter outer membrane beta-barrel domain-containing protein [Akkermansia sp.]
MKKSLFIALLMAAACPSALAIVGGTTHVEGYTASDPDPAAGSTTFYGAKTEGRAAEGATVTLTDGTPVDYVVDTVYGGWSDTLATGNTVIADQAEVEKYIIGGYGLGDTDLVAADNNFVRVTSSRVGSSVCGGVGDYGDVEGNTVFLDHVTGDEPQVYGGRSSAGEARNNTVVVAGGELGDIVAGNGAAGSIDNHVILVGKGPSFEYEVPGRMDTVRIIGGAMDLGRVSGYLTVVPDNSATLDIYGTGVTATSIENFTTLNFDLCPCLEPGMTIVTLDGGEITDLEGVAINLTPQGHSTQLEKGSTVTLIRSTNGSITGLDGRNVSFRTTDFFTTFKGTVAVEDDDKALVLHVTDIREAGNIPAGDIVKSVLETRAQSTAMVNGGADFMMSNGIWHARHAAENARNQARAAIAPFVAVGGSRLRYNTGSHIKSSGFNLATGLTGMVGGNALAAAFEYGDSSYDSYVHDLHANGKGRSWGGALLGDWELGAGWHMDTVARVGKVRNTYNADIDGPVDGRTSSTYAGASIGFGNVQQVGTDCEFDTYLRYLYTRINGGHACLSRGSRARFRSVNANRTVLGTRFLYAVAENSRIYAGAGWLQQYGGGSHGTVDGVSGPSPSLKGASGFFELGTQLAYPDNRNLAFDFNVTGWVGTQRGVSVGAGVRYAF